MTKLFSRAAAAIVAAVAGIISYGHIRAVALAVGESELAAALLPVGVDGLIVVATLAMLEDSRAGRVPRTSARFALGFGIAATIAGNIASAEPTWTARVVAAVPAVSFLIAVEVLARTGKARTRENAVRTTQTPQKTATGGKAGSKLRRKPTSERVAAAVARQPDATAAELAQRLSLSERTVQRYRPAPVVEAAPNGKVSS